ncbi:MAG: PaaI family thioesterase [Ottowia sp.]|nr:PaaI family thioesterase [Ottowia sp.]
MSSEKAFQDYYAPAFSHCYGCGPSNEHGLHIKSYWLDKEKKETFARYTPKPWHTGGYPENVYGGLIAALLDCHGNGTALAAGYMHEGRAMDSEPALRYVTGNLTLNFKKPTPIDGELEMRAKITEVTDKKVVMEVSLLAHGQVTVDGSMVCVRLPATRPDASRAAA